MQIRETMSSAAVTMTNRNIRNPGRRTEHLDPEELFHRLLTLEQKRSELLSELPHRVQEFLQLIGAPDEELLVGDKLRHLRRDLEPGGHLRGPTSSLRGGGNAVKGGVDLDRVEPARVDAQEVHLTPNEYKLLQVLIQHAGKVLTQRQLLNEVWGPQHTEQAQYLRVYIAQLRRKLERNPARPKYLQTEPGVGYRLVSEE